ncbi:MFS transporter [Streptomyces sp. NRRL F-5123]|uniref:MFS transporter n=1 Tax=Streptomyces sp. NRRL F-5123 TaxID=1463856 RepID=UPI0004E22C32|nr:MFS transporter [Streptomyces sp. NRRL F-5123]
MSKKAGGPLLALLSAEIISVSGSLVTRVALPWFVLATTGSVARMSFVLAVQMLSMALWGIPGGVLATRLGTRTFMRMADCSRAVLIGLVPLLDRQGLLTFPMLLVLVFLIGGFFTPYYASQRVLLPELVGDDEGLLARTNTLLVGANRITLLLGAPIGGVLVSAFGARAVLWIDATSFFVSFLLISLFVHTGKVAPATVDQSKLLAGVRFLWQDRIQRLWTFANIGFEMSWQCIFAAIPILAFLRYDDDPRVVGALLAVFGVGAVAGNITAIPLLRAMKPINLMITGAVAESATLWGAVVDLHVVTFGAVLCLGGFFMGFIEGPTTALQTRRTPSALRPQSMSAFMTLTLVAGSLALTFTGPAFESYDPRVPFTAVALLYSVGTALLVLSARRLAAEPASPAALRATDPKTADSDARDPA